MWEKLKFLVRDDRLFLATTLIFVALTAFALGRYSATETGWGRAAGAAVTMSYTEKGLPSADTATTQRTSSIVTESPVLPHTAAVSSGPYVASKSGTKYHHESCAGAKQIKEENKLFFTTAREAAAAGYSPAANCPILHSP
jgi:Metal binding domain of Ada